MKKILIMLFAVASVAQAELPLGEINNFNFNYNEPSGSAHAEIFNFYTYQFGRDINFLVEKQAGSLYLETPEETIEISNLPGLVLDLQQIDLKKFSLVSTPLAFDIQLASLVGNSSTQDLNISNLAVNCDYQAFDDNYLAEILNSCINNKGTIGLGFAKFGQSKKSTELSNTQLQFDKNKFNFRLKISGFNIKGYGKAYFENNMLKLRIDSAKTGIINVKGKVFTELEKLESSSVRVNNPWIEIDL